MLPFVSNSRRSFGVGVSALVSGVLLGCCFPPFDAAPLAWVAIAPLGFALAERRLTSEGWAGVYLGGLAYHVIGLAWLSHLYGQTEPLCQFEVVRFVAAQIGAAVFCVSFFLTRWATHRFRLPVCLALPAFWMSFEWVRSLVALAIDPALEPWLRLGGTQVEWLTFAQVASLGGEATLTALVALVNGWMAQVALAARAAHRGAPLRWRPTMLFAPATMLLVLAYGEWSLNQYKTSLARRVALMDREDWLMPADRREPQPELSAQRLDLLVWPELADHHRLVTGQPVAVADLPDDVRIVADGVSGDYGAWSRRRLASAAAESNAAVLVGCERIDVAGGQLRRYNSVAFADPKRGFVGYSDKQKLAPVTERDAVAAGWLGMSPRRQFSPGRATPLFTLDTAAGPRRFACVVCYDIAYQAHVAEVGQNGAADFFVHCGSEAADPTGTLSKTLLRMARLRAIETRRPIIRNCHFGASGVIDAAGRFTPCHTAGGVAATPNDQPELGRTSSLDLGSMLPVMAGVFFALRTRRDVGHRRRDRRSHRAEADAPTAGFSLLELLAVVAILGTIAAVIVPRIADSADNARARCDEMNRAQINAAVERYYLTENAWPANNLSDIGANPNYFPDGIPVNPVDESAYQLDPTTHRVQNGGGGGGGK